MLGGWKRNIPMDNIHPLASPGCWGRQREQGRFGNWIRNTSTNKNKLQTGHGDVHTVLSQSHKPLWIEAAAASPRDLPRTSHRDHLSIKKNNKSFFQALHPPESQTSLLLVGTELEFLTPKSFCGQLISYPRERVRQGASTSRCFPVLGDAPSSFG